MIVCFALLSIFITSASMVISATTRLYYQVKGETYSKQVADIIMEKILSELEGAKYDSNFELWEGDNPVISDDGKNISLYDRTDTKVTLFASEGELILDYAAINNSVDTSKSRNETLWKFDKGVYKQYRIDELVFVPGPQIASAPGYVQDISRYRIGNLSGLTYDENVVVVFLTVSSPKYGAYRLCRPVKMYYLPENTGSNP